MTDWCSPSTSMAMPVTVLTRVRASAPARRAAPAISVTSVTFGLSLAHRGRRQPAVASTASAVNAADWANIARRPSPLPATPWRFGQLRFTSTATTSAGASARAVAAFS